MTVRAFYEAAKVAGAEPPYDTLHLKVFYLARMSGSEIEKDMGVVPADPRQAPFPVVVFFNGFNCEAHSYQWLAVSLAGRGLAVVLFNWIAAFPGFAGLTPGVDIEAWKPANYGKAPTASALPAILAKLDDLQEKGILAGLLDLKRVILGGHSAGGKVAIENADPRYFPQIAGSFSYAGHSAAPLMMGYPPGVFLPLPDALPTLLMGGDCDGVIANSSQRYGMTPAEAAHSIERTFQEALSVGRSDRYLAILEGANHFSMAGAPETATGRPFLEGAATRNPDDIHRMIADLVGLFIDAHVRQDAQAALALRHMRDAPSLRTFQVK
ncbi:MAG: alpha/beta fold hydrolase [Rhodomicrobium sp.]